MKRWSNKMIVCTRKEMQVGFRAFLLDDLGPLNRVTVTTHLTLTPSVSPGVEPFCQAAGEIQWTGGGFEASVAVTAGDGFSINPDLVKLPGVFRSELDALLAIAVSYEPIDR